MQNIKDRINPHLYTIYQKLEEQAEVFEFDPKQLIWDLRRFDHAVKFVYLTIKNMYPKLTWHRSIYFEHIKAFTGGKFEEGDGFKNSFDRFLTNFEELENSFKQDTYCPDKTLIPFSVGKINVDGSHRISLAAFYNKKLEGVELKQLKEPNYNYIYFRGNKQPEWINDFTYFHRVLSNNKIRIIHIHPKAKITTKEITQIFDDFNLKVEYHKEIYLKAFAHGLIVREFYKNEKWIGNYENKFEGALGHSSKSYTSKKPLLVYFVEEHDLDKLRAIKSKIREKCKIGNFSVHINDTYQETLDLSHIFLNEQSIKFLNSCINNNTFWKTDEFLSIFRKKQTLSELADYVVVGSFPLALLGLRENRDIDIIYDDSKYKLKQSDIDTHNNYIQQFGFSYLEILNDPRQYFYWKGLKFFSLDNVWRLKKLRKEKKDYIDNVLYHFLKYSTLNTNWLYEKVNRMKIQFNPRPFIRKIVGDKFYQQLKKTFKNG